MRKFRYQQGEAKGLVAALNIGNSLSVPTFKHAESLRHAAYMMLRRLSIIRLPTSLGGYSVKRIT